MEQEPGILIDITDLEFEKLSDYVYQQAGINLTDKKKPLVRGRLSKVLKQHGFFNFSQYFDYVISDTTGAALIELINKISTNHTYFFRENEHFNFFFERALPEIENQNNPGEELRFWSAGCSSGEEPYTLAILLMEHFSNVVNPLPFRILATDISLTVLENAMEGIYPEERLKYVPAGLKAKYFTPQGNGNWKVIDKVKQHILFKRLNLMDTNFPFKQQFHGVFCRNVMIYFDKPTKDVLVQKIKKHLRTNHYFFIGHSESLGRDALGFEYIKPSIYRKTS